MSGIFLTMNFFLLQTYFKEDDPMQGLILGIAVGVIVVASIIVYIVRRLTSKTVNVAGKKTTVAPKKFSAFTMRRIASAYGLSKEQRKLLESVFRSDEVTDPERVMENPNLLDKHFKKAFRTIERSSRTDADAQRSFLKLFALRNSIEAGPRVNADSTGRLSENTPAILSCGKDSYTVKVYISRGQNVVTEIPKNVLGTPVRFAKGVPVSLSFFTKSSSGFTVDGQVAGTTNTDYGPGLQIASSGKVKSLVKRKYRRAQTGLKCTFSFVTVEESGRGRHKTSKLIVDKKTFIGVIENLSVGGCAIKTSSAIQAGARLKINANSGGNSNINVLGQVIRSNRSARGTVMHVKFQKVPGRSFNAISTVVFGYNEA